MTMTDTELGGYDELRGVTQSVSRLAEVASADAVVGPAQERDGRTVVPLASVSASYGLGIGFGRGEGGEESGESSTNGRSADGGSGEGGGGGGGGRGAARPVAVVEITDDSLRVHQVVDATEDLERVVVAPASEVAAAVQPLACAEGVRDEFVALELWVDVAAREPGSADADLSDDPARDQLELLVEPGDRLVAFAEDEADLLRVVRKSKRLAAEVERGSGSAHTG